MLEQAEKQGKKERPVILAVMLILSMLSGILSSFANFIVYVLIDAFREQLTGQETMNFMGVQFDLSLFLNIDKRFFFYQFVLYAISFAGGLLMWQWKKLGFHLYLVSQILLLILASVFLKRMPFPYPDIILTGFFVYIYAKYLKWMS